MGQELLCRDANWIDVLLFFILNYGVHVVTTLFDPGNTKFVIAERLTYSFFTPFYNVGVAVRFIMSGTFGKEGALQCAERSGALCIITRTEEWVEEDEKSKPAPVGDRGFFGSIKREIAAYRKPTAIRTHLLREGRATISGLIDLPEGYEVVKLPAHVKVKGFAPNDSIQRKLVLPCNYRSFKSIAGIVQLVFGSITIYKSKGRYLEKYGIAALTVIPYLLMTFINLMAAFSCPEYPAMFLIESEVMHEAKRRGAFINGTVGIIETEEEGSSYYNGENVVFQSNAYLGPLISRPRTSTERVWSYTGRALGFLVTWSSPFIIFWVSGWRFEEATRSQILWFIVWLSHGIVFASFLGRISGSHSSPGDPVEHLAVLLLRLFLIILFKPPMMVLRWLVERLPDRLSTRILKSSKGVKLRIVRVWKGAVKPKKALGLLFQWGVAFTPAIGMFIIVVRRVLDIKQGVCKVVHDPET